VTRFALPDLAELYSRPYDERMVQWRRICARDKARNILQMTPDVAKPIPSVLEVGCGTGAVLRELAASGVGSTLTGIEIGSTRSKEEQESIGGATIHIHGYDGVRIPYDDGTFDLVYATHVLEHVLNERGFLCELRRVSKRYVYVEVPCELHMRTNYKSLQTTLEIGHINSYTPESFALTLETSGLAVRRLKLLDHSYDVYRYGHAESRAQPPWKAAAKLVLRRSLLSANSVLASRVLSYHCGALCELAPVLSI
jgi:ubiquinone/menaquinone biosynthesis C-methylase UbiE